MLYSEQKLLVKHNLYKNRLAKDHGKGYFPLENDPQCLDTEFS